MNIYRKKLERLQKKLFNLIDFMHIAVYEYLSQKLLCEIDPHDMP